MVAYWSFVVLLTPRYLLRFKNALDVKAEGSATPALFRIALPSELDYAMRQWPSDVNADCRLRRGLALEFHLDYALAIVLGEVDGLAVSVGARAVLQARGAPHQESEPARSCRRASGGIERSL